MRVDVVRPYVEKLLKEFFHTDSLIVDRAGDWPVRFGSAMYYVRLMDGTPPVVQVFSPLLKDVKKSPELMEALNEANASIRFARVYWANDAVVATIEMIAETMDRQELENACFSVSAVADRYDTELKGRFGGSMSFEDAPPPGTPPQEKPADV